LSRPTGEGVLSAEAQREQRLAALEAAVRELQRQMISGVPAANWLERVTGSMKDEPAFEDVLEYGKAIQQADRPSEDADR
jgi:hypothetical protein